MAKMSKMAYCISCDDDVDFVTKPKEITVTVKGDRFKVAIKEAFCSKCGRQVFPASLEKENEIIIYDEYRRRHSLLTSVQIIDIRKRLGMSQTAFAEFIGCGEKNIARYENGLIQDKTIDNLMKIAGSTPGYNILASINNPKSQWVVYPFADNVIYDQELKLTCKNGGNSKTKKSYDKWYRPNMPVGVYSY